MGNLKLGNEMNLKEITNSWAALNAASSFNRTILFISGCKKSADECYDKALRILKQILIICNMLIMNYLSK